MKTQGGNYGHSNLCTIYLSQLGCIQSTVNAYGDSYPTISFVPALQKVKYTLNNYSIKIRLQQVLHKSSTKEAENKQSV
jgi:hypothetical protein